jgi:hypothetical protein
MQRNVRSYGEKMKPANDGFNLLRIRPIRALIQWLGFPYVFQAFMLVFFVALALIGWGHFTPEGVNDKLYAKTNIVNLLIWGLWWPAMIWVAVLLGRAWCMICPLELVANLSERMANAIGIRQRTLGRWLRSGALIIIIYALLQLLVAGIHIHRVPAYTSYFLWGLLATAMFVGFIYKDRAFCRGFCPVGLLLNAYGRGGTLAVRAGSGQTCASCTGKDCIMACNRNRLDARSCPSLLNPPKLNSNKDCLMCGQCIKSCEPDNMQLLLRRPFHAADAREPVASWPLTLFIMLASGFVTSELTTEWENARKIFVWAPEYFASVFQLSAFKGWIEGLWTLFVFPLAIWSVLGAVTVIFKRSEKISQAWRKLALPLAILISAGHMSKALAKFTSWVGFLPLSLHDPLGITTATAIASKSLSPPAPWLSLHTVSILGLVLISLGIVFSIREARLTHPETYHHRLFPKFALAAVFVVIVAGWGG